MSEPNAEMENSQPPEGDNESLAPANAKLVDENDLLADGSKDDKLVDDEPMADEPMADGAKDDQLVAENDLMADGAKDDQLVDDNEPVADDPMADGAKNDKPVAENDLIADGAKDDNLVDETDPMADGAKEDTVANGAGDELAAQFAVNGIDEPPRVSKKLDMPSLELSDDFNSTDSDSFASRAQKNRTLEMKLSAIIEKACSSDVEAEEQPEAQPAANVTVTLPNNQLLFTVEGLKVPAEVGDESAPQELLTASTRMPTRRKKYMYKLKSKGGAMLTYTSYVPVVLKKPRISLTRIEVKPSRAKKKAVRAPVNGKRSRGRPKKPASASDASPDVSPAPDLLSDSNSSFGMQTRKRKLKFWPDGRIKCIAKRRRSSSSSVSDDRDSPPPKESTDEDWEATGDDLRKLNSQSDETEAKPASKTKSHTPKTTKVATVKLQKSQTAESPKTATPRLTKAAAVGKTFVANNAASAPAFAQKPSVNPAQLLSTLLGITIRPNQLNTVRFKPKSFQKQHVSSQKTIVLNGDDLKGVAANFRSAAKATPKPLMQKILPKSSLTSIFNKTANASHSSSILSLTLSGDLVSPVAPQPEPPLEVPNFDAFTDSRTVRTKAGPKKLLLQQKLLELDASEKLNRLTVYDLAQNVFDRMPSWNLHLMPDTNTFCIAQVGRGRMGIPILKKSVELSDNFAAKIFVHQLHCKKFDGVYDTEAKINSLIADIDSLAA